MGTFATITVSPEDVASLGAAGALSRTVLQDLDNRLSLFKPDSEISRLNQAAGASPMRVSTETEEVLRLSRRYAEATGGAFNPTVAPLVRFWGFNNGTPLPGVPDRAAIASVLERVGYRHLVVSNATAFLDREGMSVDLGGIAKGYAVDKCHQALATTGVRNVMINLGGNIRCRGSAAPGRPWAVGVRDPFNRDRLLGTLRLADGMAVATSGNYEKSVTIEGKRYTHIMDPRTGWPVEGVASVTIIADTAVEADAMSTAVFVLGLDESRRVLSHMTNCQVIFIPDERPTRLYLSPGARGIFTADPAFEGTILDIALDPAQGRGGATGATL